MCNPLLIKFQLELHVVLLLYKSMFHKIYINLALKFKHGQEDTWISYCTLRVYSSLVLILRILALPSIPFIFQSLNIYVIHVCEGFIEENLIKKVLFDSIIIRTKLG